MTLPTGRVTFLFGDVEGSTAILERLGADYADELAAHRTLVREVVAGQGGEIVDQRGEEVFAVFGSADSAVAAAAVIQRRQAVRHMRVRLGLHTGEPALTGDGYVGLDVHRAARICSAAHGGQILLSEVVAHLVPDQAVKELGLFWLRDLSSPERLYQVVAPDLSTSFAAPRATPVVGRRAARPRAQRAEPTIDDLSWAVRARLPDAQAEDRAALGTLASALSIAARVATSARRFVAGIDRQALDSRRAHYLRTSVRSTRAGDAAAAASERIELLDAVVAGTALLEHTAFHSSDAGEIGRHTAALETSLERARAALGSHDERLRRTLRRGVHRSPSGEYVVVDHDTVGVERRHHFRTSAEARAYRDAMRLGLTRREAYTGPSFKHGEVTAGGGPM